MDAFTKKRLTRFVESHRQSSGQLPTLKDFDDHGFDRELIKEALKEKILSEFYVTLTSGTILKGYKILD